MKMNASIVLYDNDKELVIKAIHSFLNTKLYVKLYLIDNSATDILRCLSDISDRIEYIFNAKNLGFGTAHNISLQTSIDDNVPYHLVLNPDIYYEHGVVEELINYMDSNTDIANVMPKIYYPDGDVQHLCKMLPTPFELIVRRFSPISRVIECMNKIFELHKSGYDKCMNIPYLSGCFMLLRTDSLKQVGLFDENIFLYMEDLDLNRRLHIQYRTMFYPHVSVVHVHAKESYKRTDYLWMHIKSTIYYFNKWGWFLDKSRKKINNDLHSHLKGLTDDCP
jgi:GT2 family glycosyltransferase